ncbi:MAG: glycoside hydrolase family 18 protein [Clostridia bacterium]|nr:glycoside hydrolase family 18 protein [Clostridia bacterium]
MSKKRIIKHVLRTLTFMVLISCITIGMVAFKADTALSNPTGTINHSKMIVGYFPEWGIYSAHSFYKVSDIPWDKVTHINYAFARITQGKIDVDDTWAAVEKPFEGDKSSTPIKGNFGQLIKYKRMYPNVKTMISVGGWTRSLRFSDIASTEMSRSVFADSCVAFIKKYQFDGIDIDWEYPVRGGAAENQYRPEDKHNFTLLLKKLREKLNTAGVKDGRHYLLSIAATAGYLTIPNIEPELFQDSLDHINLMSYDYNGTWDHTTNHLAPLYMNPKDPSFSNKKLKCNVNWSVKEYLRQKVPSVKLNVGIPYFSRGWRNVTGANGGLFDKANGSPKGLWDNTSKGGTGTNPFYYIKSVLEVPGSDYKKYWDSYAKVPYLWNASKKIMYTYDDEASVLAKCDYILENNLGGVMLWELTGDYPIKGCTLTKVIYDKFKTACKPTPKPTSKPTPKPTPKPTLKPSHSPLPEALVSVSASSSTTPATGESLKIPLSWEAFWKD